MAGFLSRFALRRRWFVLLSLLAVVLSLVVGGVLWHGVETASVAALQVRIETLKPVLTGLRLGLIGLVFLLWPCLANVLHGGGRIDEARAKMMQAQRGRLLTWLLVIELLLGQNLLGQVLASLQGG